MAMVTNSHDDIIVHYGQVSYGNEHDMAIKMSEDVDQIKKEEEMSKGNDTKSKSLNFGLSIIFFLI